MINVNQQALLELLKASLFGIEPRFPDCVDWDAVLQEAKDQTVIALAAPAVPKEETEKWRVPVTRNKMRFLQILDEQTILVKLFQNAGIPLTILKGCAAAMYYPNPFLRGMGDVDVYIPECLHEKVRELLLKEEYEIEEDNEPSNRHSTFSKNNIVFEVHRSFATVNGPEEKAYIDGFLEEYCRDVTKAARIEQVLIWR